MSRTLWKIACSDVDILKDCDKETRNRFTHTGTVVSVICVLCFVSAYRSFLLLLDNSLIAIPLSLFFAWMIFNIYRLLLVTLAKNLLPHKSDKKSPIISLILRMTFIGFLALIVAKPLETLLFSDKLDIAISEHKAELQTEFANKLDSFYGQRLSGLQSDLNDEKEINEILEISGTTPYMASIQKEMNGIVAEKQKSIALFQSLIDRSNFFAERLRVLGGEMPYSWVLSILIVSLFLTPAWLKYRIGETTYYYKRKGIVEKELVLDEYNQFKEHYSTILKDVTGREIQFAESYADAPFNTKKITDDRKILKKEELIKWIKAQNKKKK